MVLSHVRAQYHWCCFCGCYHKWSTTNLLGKTITGHSGHSLLSHCDYSQPHCHCMSQLFRVPRAIWALPPLWSLLRGSPWQPHPQPPPSWTELRDITSSVPIARGTSALAKGHWQTSFPVASVQQKLHLGATDCLSSAQQCAQHLGGACAPRPALITAS